MRFFPALLFCTLPLLANDTRAELSGKWRLDTSTSQLHSHPPSDLLWTIDVDVKDDGIHFAETSADKSSAWEVTCSTRGADCKVKDAAKPITVSFWYNGPALVEIETDGKNKAVTKRRMTLSPDGSTLTVEVTHLVPDGRAPEKLVMKKQP
jgi:hypothetical protein